MISRRIVRKGGRAGGGGGDGDGERACLDDLGLALRGELLCFGFGSGLSVSLDEALPESLSVAADFGLKAESAEEEAVRRRGGHRWFGGEIYHFGRGKGSQVLGECRSNCFLPRRWTSWSVALTVGSDVGCSEAAVKGEGDGRKVAQ